MNKARKKFVLLALLAIFVLLSVLLGVISGVNYTMAGEDADAITQMLAEGKGDFPFPQMGENIPKPMDMRNGPPAQIAPLGPQSPEMSFSLRYFTFAFDNEGNAQKIAFEENK